MLSIFVASLLTLPGGDAVNSDLPGANDSTAAVCRPIHRLENRPQGFGVPRDDQQLGARGATARSHVDPAPSSETDAVADDPIRYLLWYRPKRLRDATMVA